MDIITHALLGAAIAPDKNLALPMAISGVVPDLWTVPPLVEYLWRKRGRFRNQEFWAWIPPRYLPLTLWSHSLFPLFAAALVGLLFSLSLWVFLPWFLHLLVDIPTHAKTRTGRPFYPFSWWQPLGLKNWYDMWWLSVFCIVVFGGIVFIRFLQ